MYDVLVVGARCAGASLAMLLARAGQRVALVDRATFPSDTMSTHFLWPRGLACLSRWGLLEELYARGCVPIREITFDVGDVRLTGIGPAVSGVRESCCPRRTVLDLLLVESAVRAGADLIDGFLVEDVEWRDGRASGIRGRARGAAVRSTIGAALIVGADGLRSTVADRVGARPYRYAAPMTCAYYSYWSGVRRRRAAFYQRPGRLVLVWPTNDGLTCVYVAWPADEFSRVRVDVPAEVRSAVEQVPDVAGMLVGARREGPFVGTRSLPNQYVSSAGPGWVLAGDAGHHKDPATGMGMTDAFASAEILADCLLNRPRESLVGYQQRRDEATALSHELTMRAARLAPVTPRMREFYRSAAGDARLTEQVFGVLGATIPVAALGTARPSRDSTGSAPSRSGS